jgi:hypothetical protein
VTPERWQRIKQIASDALELPAEARAAFVDAACADAGGDAAADADAGALREEVLSRIDGDGKPAVVYWLRPADDYNSVLAFWRPGESAAVKVADTVNHQTDAPDAHFTFRDREAWVTFHAMRDDQSFNNVHQMWVARSTDGGATWTAPVPVPADGGNSLGPPVNIAASAAGRAVVTAWVDGGNSGGTRCGQPKLIQSVDGGKTWTICSAETSVGSPTRDAVYPMPAFARNSKLYIVFKTNATEGALQTGLVLWRER